MYVWTPYFYCFVNELFFFSLSLFVVLCALHTTYVHVAKRTYAPFPFVLRTFGMQVVCDNVIHTCTYMYATCINGAIGARQCAYRHAYVVYEYLFVCVFVCTYTHAHTAHTQYSVYTYVHTCYSAY